MPFYLDSIICTFNPKIITMHHQDSVVSVSFNWDSSYFATCDLSGIIKVWKSANQENVISFETGDFSVS
jgi:WD40 repeat protein